MNGNRGGVSSLSGWPAGILAWSIDTEEHIKIFFFSIFKVIFCNELLGIHIGFIVEFMEFICDPPEVIARQDNNCTRIILAGSILILRFNAPPPTSYALHRP